MAAKSPRGMGDDHFKEELGRRTLQIEDLRDELWQARDRLAEAETRYNTLNKTTAKLEHEIGIRRACGNGLEDKVALQEAVGEDADRAFNVASAAGMSEIAVVQQQAAVEGAAVADATRNFKEFKEQARSRDLELADMQAQLDSARRAAERSRESLAKAEANECERLQAVLSRREGDDNRTLELAQQKLEAIFGESREARNLLTTLDAELNIDKERIESIKNQLKEANSSQEEATKQCEVLELAVKSVEAKSSNVGTGNELAAIKKETQSLQQELNVAKKDTMMRTNGISGAIEETQRMMKDHLDQTQHDSADQSFSVLLVALSEAKAKSSASETAAKRLAKDCADMAIETAHAEELLAQAGQQESSKKRNEALMQQIVAARQTFEDNQRREQAARMDEAKAKLSLEDAERSYREQELLLRSKLEEIRRPLQWRAAAHAQVR